MAKNVVLLADDFQQASRELLREMLAPTTHLQDRELIAAETTHEIACSQTRRQTLCHALQIAITNLMAVVVVDFFEAIKVDPV